jgi:hypothetical protein
MHRF